MIKPKALQFGDWIGVVAPAGPVEREKIENGKKQLENLGFQVKMGDACYKKHGYLAGSDEERARDLNKMFADETIKGIFCLRGGYGGMKILPLLRYDIIRKNPKIFVGYSDITAIHSAIQRYSKLITFHGPMVASDLSKELDDVSRKSLLQALMNKTPMGSIKNPIGEEIKTLVGGTAKGSLVGGNLALLVATLGTPYELNTKGKILFLEDIGEEPYRIDRMLTQLLLGRKLQEVTGIVLGDFKNCEGEKESGSLSLREIFEEIIIPLKKPTIYNVKAGHCTPKLTLPFGVKASIDGDRGMFTIESIATR